jgi:hypothetical protein
MDLRAPSGLPPQGLAGVEFFFFFFLTPGDIPGVDFELGG